MWYLASSERFRRRRGLASASRESPSVLLTEQLPSLSERPQRLWLSGRDGAQRSTTGCPTLLTGSAIPMEDAAAVRARIAAEDQVIALDEVWGAWAAADLETRRRATAKDEAEAVRLERLEQAEIRDLRKKRHWGGIGATARWRLHLAGVPTTRANGTYGLIGAPQTMENMNLQRCTKWGGGPPLDVKEASSNRMPLRKQRLVPKRFPNFRNANFKPSYDWHAQEGPHDARRAARGVLRHVPSTIMSRPHSTNRFEDSTLFSEDSQGAASLTAAPVRRSVGRDPTHAKRPISGGPFGRASTNRAASSEARGDPNLDPLFHPKGPVLLGENPAAFGDGVMGAYLATLSRARAGAPS